MSEDESFGPEMKLATEEHVAVLLMLQDAFHKYTPGEKSDGDIRFAIEICNDHFTEDDFRNIVLKEECVLLYDGEMPVAYMLIDSCSQTQALKDYRNAIEIMLQDNFLDKDQRLAPRYAELLHPSLYDEQYIDIRWQMLIFLVFHNHEKYDCMLYAFFTNAGILFEKLKQGWKIAFDNGMYFILTWDIKGYIKN